MVDVDVATFLCHAQFTRKNLFRNNLKEYTPISRFLQRLRISSLLSMKDNIWDVDLVLDIFDSRDANLNFSIPMNDEVNDS